MTISFLDLVRVATATVGVGTMTLGGAANGYLSFAAAGAVDGATYRYAIQDGNNSEIGLGVYSAGAGTLTRGPTKSTNSNAAISLSGRAQVIVCLAAEDMAIGGPIFGTMAGQNASAIAVTGGSITGLPTPVNPSDAATKGYVDATASGLSVRDSCAWATAAALPANTYANGTAGVGATLTANANGTLSVDGNAPALGDRVLVQNEAASHNGIYTVTATGGAGAPWVLTRATDANASSNIFSGLFVFVVGGTVNAGAGFVLTTAGAVVVGTTSLVWTQFSGAGEITNGAGLAKAGNTLSVATAGIAASMLAAGVFANPGPTYGVNLGGSPGTAGTAMRSDAVLKLDPSIAPTWTGQHTFNQSIIGSALFTNVQGAGFGFATIREGSSSQTGYFEWWNPADVRTAYLGADSGSTLTLSLNAINHVITGGLVGINTTTPGSTAVACGFPLFATGAGNGGLDVGGVLVLHAEQQAYYAIGPFASIAFFQSAATNSNGYAWTLDNNNHLQLLHTSASFNPSTVIAQFGVDWTYLTQTNANGVAPASSWTTGFAIGWNHDLSGASNLVNTNGAGLGGFKFQNWNTSTTTLSDYYSLAAGVAWWPSATKLGFGSAAPSASNYALYGDASNTQLNVPSSGTISLRVNNVSYVQVVPTGATFNVPVIAAGGENNQFQLINGTQQWNISLNVGAGTGGSETGGLFYIRDATNNVYPFQLKPNAGGLSLGVGGGNVYFGATAFTGGSMVYTGGGGLQLGSPTGGDLGVGKLNVSAGIYLNNTAYTNPDYVFERHFTGRIERFAAPQEGGSAWGARRRQSYPGLMTLDDLERHVAEHLRFPGIDDDPADIFERADIALEKLEETTLYLFELNKRLSWLEGRHA